MSTTRTTPKSRRRAGRLGVLLGTLALAAALLAAIPAGASAAPKWDARTYWGPTNLQPGERGGVFLEVANVGDTQAEGWPTVEVALPDGVSIDTHYNSNGFGWSCSPAGTQIVTCANPLAAFFPPIWPKPSTYTGFGLATYVQFTVDIAADAPTGLQPLEITLSGAGATEATSIEEQVRIGGAEEGFGIREGTFKAEALDQAGDPYTQAGGHPFEVVTEFTPATKFNEPDLSNSQTWSEIVQPVENLKDVVVDAPPGFSGDTLATPTCPKSVVAYLGEACPPEAQVGVAETNNVVVPMTQLHAVYNVVPEKGTPAQFMFIPGVGNPVLLTPVLRSDGEWDLSVQVKNIGEENPLFHSVVRLWGIPADAAHDELRCEYPSHVGQKCAGYSANGEPSGGGLDFNLPHPSTSPRRAFLTLPTECDGLPEITTIHEASWQAKPFARYQPDGDPDLSDPTWVSNTAEADPITGCEELEFEPSLKARPTTNAADSPTGLDVDLHIPQNMDPDGLASAHLKETTVTLPEGLVVNPSGANGLGACSEDQANLDTRLPDECPEASKIGTVSVETPILEDPVVGSVYVAKPFDNPFNSLLAIYIAIDDEKTGIVGKLAGRVTPDPKTGRLSATFKDNPQLPFEDFHLDFFGGAAASLKTPATCGTYATSSELTPWSAPHTGPPVQGKDSWQITQGPNGSGCASSDGALPNKPSFEAGSSSPIAGAHSPFVVNLRRDDGTQQFGTVKLTPPQGLLAKLAGTETCSDSSLAIAEQKKGADEQASPSCPSASQIGTVIAGAGAGPAPYYAEGKAYLAGPYKGAPISLAIITPAVAGPFDLGTIVLRTALHLDPVTAQITAISDPIPQILQGIPLDVRSASIRIDKPQFTLNPTSCDESSVSGELLSTLGASASLTSRFQVGECARLGFKPSLKLSLKGGTKRGKYPALKATLKPRPGDANIQSISVSLPHSEFLAQEHIRTICTRVQWAQDNCPKAAIYGRATVTTPLLDYPLTGPVYLRSSDNTLPDLVPDLRGPAYQPIRLEAAGRTDSKNQGIRNTFGFVPDAPFTKLVLQMPGGRKGLLVNSTDICQRKHRATVSFGAHNGKTHVARPLLKAPCGKGRKARGKAGKKQG